MIAPPQLQPGNYTSWRKEMVFWEHATNVDKKKRAATRVFYKMFIRDLLYIDPMKVKIICKTDNSGMHYSMHSSTQILDKCLRIEMAILREMIANRDIYNIT